MLPVFIGTSSDGVELLPGKAEGRRDSPSPSGQSMGSLMGFSHKIFFFGSGCTGRGQGERVLLTLGWANGALEPLNKGVAALGGL